MEPAVVGSWNECLLPAGQSCALSLETHCQLPSEERCLVEHEDQEAQLQAAWPAAGCSGRAVCPSSGVAGLPNLTRRSLLPGVTHPGCSPAGGAGH